MGGSDRRYGNKTSFLGCTMKEVKVLLMALCACALVGVFSACDYKAVSSNNDSSNVIENGDLTESLRF